MIGTAILVAFAAGVLVCVGLWTRDEQLPWRCATLLMLALLLAGMLLPADGIVMLRDWVAGVFGEWEVDAPGPSADLWAHSVLFAVTGLMVGRLKQRYGWARVLGCLLALAVMTEVVQFASPGRQPSWLDVGANMLGLSVGLALLAGLMAVGTRLSAALQS